MKLGHDRKGAEVRRILHKGDIGTVVVQRSLFAGTWPFHPKRWEASLRLGPHFWTFAYGRTRTTAERNLRKSLAK